MTPEKAATGGVKTPALARQTKLKRTERKKRILAQLDALLKKKRGRRHAFIPI